MGILVQLPINRRDEQNTKGTDTHVPNKSACATATGSKAEGEGRPQAAVLLFTGVRYERQNSPNSSSQNKIVANSNCKSG